MRLHDRVAAVAAIARWNLRLLLRSRLFWLVTALGGFNFLLHFALIYLKAQVAVEQPFMAAMLDGLQTTGTGEAYRRFLGLQFRAVFLVLAFAGVLVLVGDHRSGGLVFYLSRPIGRSDYLLGKLATLATVTGALTLVPALILWGAYGLFSNSMLYYWTNLHLAAAIVAYALLIMLVSGLLALTVADLTRSGTAYVVGWCVAFLVLPVVGRLLQSVTDDSRWRLLSVWTVVRRVGAACFTALSDEAADGEPPFSLAAALLVLAVLTAACVWSVLHRLRPVEIVR